MNKFKPTQPDRFIKKEKDQALVKMGHLNAVVDEINRMAEATVVGEVTIENGVVGKVVEATATADGLTTGALSGASQFVTVTSANSAHKVSLPALSANMVGAVIRGKVGANGFKLQVAPADATTGKLNNVTTNVSAQIPANVSFRVECISATEWILTTTTALGAAGTPIVPA